MIVDWEDMTWNINTLQTDSSYYDRYCNWMVEEEFLVKFKQIGELDSMPQLTLQYMKELKSEFVDTLINWNAVISIGDSARLLASWIDAMLEYTILKHEALYLTAKKATV